VKILLDTFAFLWITAAMFLDKDNERYLSTASAWEIGIKAALGRLALPGKPTVYIPRIREKSGILSLPMDEEAALFAAALPDYHSDLFDRMLIAQAILHGMTILTPDPALERYPVRTAW